jgi:hypothetical protein
LKATSKAIPPAAEAAVTVDAADEAVQAAVVLAVAPAQIQIHADPPIAAVPIATTPIVADQTAVEETEADADEDKPSFPGSRLGTHYLDGSRHPPSQTTSRPPHWRLLASIRG